jgi:hypothetical protein
MNDVPAGERWFGYPAMRGPAYLRRLMSGNRTGRRTSVGASALPRDE